MGFFDVHDFPPLGRANPHKFVRHWKVIGTTQIGKITVQTTISLSASSTKSLTIMFGWYSESSVGSRYRLT